MKITNNIDIVRNGAGDYVLNGGDSSIPQTELKVLYSACRGLNDAQRSSVYCKMYQRGQLPSFEANIKFKVADRDKGTMAIDSLMNFFSEFQFVPNFRFLNTLVHEIASGNSNNYVMNYFKLVDSPYAAEIENKLSSIEFKSIINDLSGFSPRNRVNDRFKLYYGAQGTGKTTEALKETGNLVMVCNASLLPADLMEDFTFDDGKAAFHPSILVKCMEEGKPIVLDEMNLLPFDSLRFLQGILDGKREINYKGNTIHINDGFEIIGTMNLVVNGVTFGLPEPLVDRCGYIKEFKLNAEQLIDSIM